MTSPLPAQVSPAQRAAAEQAWSAGRGLLESGAQAAGQVLLADLLRAVHSCRVAGLHRLSAVGLRVAQHVRDLHARRPEFRLAAFAWDAYQLLNVAHRLMSVDAVGVEWIGVARRGYAEVLDLRLSGLFTEAVVSSSGYAGAVTCFVDQHGVLWSLGDVAPGDARRCLMAYVTPMDHRALCRAALAMERGTASDNRRLGSGRAVVAARIDGLAWSEAPPSALWAASLDAQIGRAFAARDAEQRVAGDDLVFLRGRVAGASRDALLIALGGSTLLRGVAPSAHAELPYRRNLQLLGGAVGLEVLLVARVVFGQPRTLALLAVGGDGLRLPDEWRGRVNLGLDRLQPTHLPPPGAPPAASSLREAEAPVDPLQSLARRLQQILLGGRSAVSAATWGGYKQDEATLRQRHMPTAADLLARLRESPPEGLAEAWLAARIYLTAAEAQLQKEAWLA